MCTRPVFGCKIGYRLDGQWIEEHKYLGGLYEKEMEGVAHDYAMRKYPDTYIIDIYPVPCGQCIQCRLKKSQEWADRCVLESLDYEYNYFLTLTYDDAHLPFSNTPGSDGEYRPTIVPEHLQKFNKDLRRYFDYHYKHYNIRFFAAGEYGDTTNRPHYHQITFNLPIPDLKVWKHYNGTTYYTSEILNKIWKRGYVVVANTEYDSCAYVARYTLKKQTGEKGEQYYKDLGVQPEFSRCSRMPGIGAKYFHQNWSNIYGYNYIDSQGCLNYKKGSDEIIIPKRGSARIAKPSRYFDKLYEQFYDPERDVLSAIKGRRNDLAEMHEAIRRKSTDLSDIEYYAAQERKMDNIKKKLPRHKTDA